jgi:hypothetical protein
MCERREIKFCAGLCNIKFSNFTTAASSFLLVGGSPTRAVLLTGKSGSYWVLIQKKTSTGKACNWVSTHHTGLIDETHNEALKYRGQLTKTRHICWMFVRLKPLHFPISASDLWNRQLKERLKHNLFCFRMNLANYEALKAVNCLCYNYY